MADAPATAVDKSKETTPPAHKEAADKAAEKLKADASDKKVDPLKPDAAKADGTKAEAKAPADGKKDGADQKDPAKPEDKSWTDRALDEVRSSSLAQWMGIKPVDASHVAPKKVEPTHLDMTPPPFDSVIKTPAAGPDAKAEAKPEAEKTGIDWLWSKVTDSATAAKDYVTSSWDSLTKSVSAYDTSMDKFGDNKTTRKSADGEYQLAYNAMHLTDMKAETKDVSVEIKDGQKHLYDKNSKNSFSFDKNGDVIDSKDLHIVTDKAGNRRTYDKDSGEIFVYNTKSQEGYKLDKEGHRTDYNRDEVRSNKGFIEINYELDEHSKKVRRNERLGSVTVTGDVASMQREHDRVELDRKHDTFTIIGTDGGKDIGVSHKYDFKTHTVTTDDHGKITTGQSWADFVKEHPEYAKMHVTKDNLRFSQKHCNERNEINENDVQMNRRAASAEGLVVTDQASGKRLGLTMPGEGKVKEVVTDAAGHQLGNTTLINPHDKAHVWQEVNQKGVIVTDMDVSHKDLGIHFNDAQGHNIMSANGSSTTYGYGDSAVTITGDDKVYGAHGELYNDGSPGASEVAEAAAVQAQSDAYVAVAAASTAASIVASALSSPGSMDAGYLAGVLGSAYSAASAAMGQSMSSNSAGGILAANSAMALIESKFGEIGRVTGERTNLEGAGLSPDEVNAALKLSMAGNYTPGQAQEVFKQQDNPAA